MRYALRMVRASWNGKVLAESDRTVVVEGNHYFPPDSIRREYFSESAHTSTCGWKGLARYYTIEVDGERNENAAWHYPEPKQAASNIAGYIAFWNGVRVSDA